MTTLITFLCFLGLASQVRDVKTAPQSNVGDGLSLTPSMSNLLNYGSAIPPSANGSLHASSTPETEEEADEAMRILVELVEGGRSDEYLVDFLNFPRCSDPTAEVSEYSTIGNKWQKDHLTYYVSRQSEKLTVSEVDKIIKDAFQIWANVSSLTFSEVFEQTMADIVIHFQGRDHGDRFPFDGRGGVLGHAFQPRSGKCHIDDDENWTLPESTSGFSLMQVMVHELGHVLGLGHSNEPMAIMGRFYKYGQKYRFPSLSDDDIEGIQSLYGKPMVETPKPAPPHGACTENIDAVAYDTHMGEILIFRGNFVWRLGPSSADVTEVDFSYQFLPSNLDAVFYHPTSRRTFAFKSCYLYRYLEGKLLQRSRILQTYSNLPCNINAAFYSEIDQLTYIFRNRWVYGFSGRRFYGRIRISSLPWTNIPDEIKTGFDAAADVTEEHSVYFFKGDHYYVMDSRNATFRSESYNINENLIPECLS